MCGVAAVHDLVDEPSPARLAEGRALGEDMLSRLHHRGPDGTALGWSDRPGWGTPGSRSSTWTAASSPWWTGPDVAGWSRTARSTTTRSCARGSAARSPPTSDSEIVLTSSGPSATGRHPRHARDVGLLRRRRERRRLAGPGPARREAALLGPVRRPGAGCLRAACFPRRRTPERRGVPDRVTSGPVGRPGAVRRPARRPAGRGRHVGAEFTSREDAQEAIRETLVRAVLERTMADVPVGVFLSGGLDSSVVAAILARESSAQDPPGVRCTRSRPAPRGAPTWLPRGWWPTCSGWSTTNASTPTRTSFAVLPEVVAATESYEPSLIRSAVPNYLLAELAARHVKVVLTGEGADELFAGYHHLRELDEDALRDRPRRRGRGAAQPEPAAVRPGHDGARPRGARAVPLPRDARGRAAGPGGVEAARRGRPGEAAAARGVQGWLPDEILWRRKEQFGDGSGTADAMSAGHGLARAGRRLDRRTRLAVCRRPGPARSSATSASSPGTSAASTPSRSSGRFATA